MREKIKKSTSIVLLSIAFVTAIPTSAMALVADEINIQNQVQPRLTYIADSMINFSINNGVAEVECWVKGNVLDATKAKVIAELQVKNGNNWIPVKIWTDTRDGYRASVYETYDINPNNTYRVKAIFYVWEGSQSENIIVFSSEKP